MTEEQMTLIKTLIKKHGISATDGEWTLVFLGTSYGLTEKQIDSYLIADTSDLLAKHEKMLCILFGIEPESNGEIQRMENPAERLQMLLAEYLAHNQSKQGYEEGTPDCRRHRLSSFVKRWRQKCRQRMSLRWREIERM